MAVKVYIDGAIWDPEDAVISVFDRGFLYGDSVYEVVRTSNGRPLDLGPHLERLAHSADALHLDAPDREQISAAVDAALQAAANPESYVRVIVTRGEGEIGLDPGLADVSRLIVIVRPLKLLPERAYREGIKLAVVGVQRNSRRAMDPAVKSGNYLNNVMAVSEARRRGADEAVMCNAKGQVAEASSSNVFVVRNGKVRTPAVDVGILSGITRMRVIELARGDGIEVEECVLTPADLYEADELFTTSSIRGIVPVAAVDDSVPKLPVVGPTTQRIRELYSRYMQQQGQL